MSKGIDQFSLRGRTALVTGACGYLGRAMVEAMGSAGARMLVNSRDKDKAARFVEQLLSQDIDAEVAAFDVTDAKAIAKFAERMAEEKIHILVNNAYAGQSGSISHTSADAYEQAYEITVVAAHNLTRALLPNLRSAAAEDGDASIINIASMYGMVSPDIDVYPDPAQANPPSYGAAKAAIIQWSRYAACEFGSQKIRVNSISPGPFPNPAHHSDRQEFVDSLASKVPLGRVGNAKEIGAPAVFLASAASSFVNGANLVVDGGWTSR